MSPADLVVFAGVLNNTKESSEDTKVVRRVTEVFVHEDFDEETLTNDIAIVKVSSGFPTENPAVKSIELREDVAPNGLKCTVSGWGRMGNKNSATSQTLQFAIVRLLTYEECYRKYNNSLNAHIKPGMICAYYIQDRQGACYGDSGGPLECGGLLTGIVSWGKECASAKYPDVYADVSYYREWIQRQLRKGKDEL